MSHEGFSSKISFLYPLILFKFMFLVFIFFNSSVQACPSFLYFKDLKINSKIPTSNLRLYSYSESSKTWTQEYFDIEKVDNLSQIEMKSINNKELNPVFNNNIRLVFDFDSDSTTSKDRASSEMISQKPETFACKDFSFIYEIYSPKHHAFLYLTDCPNNSFTATLKNTVLNDVNKNLVYSTFFKFFHYPKNHVAFKEIKVISSDKKNFVSAADNSVLTIYLDIKYFLSIELGASSLFSQVKSWSKTPQQNIADLIFFWKLLFMDIDVKMSATSSFYKESMYTPFKMNVPVEARDYLNSTSGSLYSWNANDVISYDTSGATIPIFNISEVKKPRIKKIVQKYCSANTCKFSLNGSAADFNFSAYFAMDKRMVDLGFFPYLVKDEAQARVDLGWDSEINSSLKNRVGIYLNISGLRAGDYSWDFWIDVDKNKTNLSAVCPSPIRVAPVFVAK